MNSVNSEKNGQNNKLPLNKHNMRQKFKIITDRNTLIKRKFNMVLNANIETVNHG